MNFICNAKPMNYKNMIKITDTSKKQVQFFKFNKKIVGLKN